MKIEFSGEIYLWSASEAWHFVNLPAGCTSELKELTEGLRRGFGSIRVDARVGKTSFRTSIFPDSKTGCFILPLKKQVRVAENLVAGGMVAVELELVDF